MAAAATAVSSLSDTAELGLAEQHGQTEVGSQSVAGVRVGHSAVPQLCIRVARPAKGANVEIHSPLHPFRRSPLGGGGAACTRLQLVGEPYMRRMGEKQLRFFFLQKSSAVDKALLRARTVLQDGLYIVHDLRHVLADAQVVVRGPHAQPMHVLHETRLEPPRHARAGGCGVSCEALWVGFFGPRDDFVVDIGHPWKKKDCGVDGGIDGGTGIEGRGKEKTRRQSKQSRLRFRYPS